MSIRGDPVGTDGKDGLVQRVRTKPQRGRITSPAAQLEVETRIQAARLLASDPPLQSDGD